MEKPLLATLSPSRASDFKKCPQLYKYKAIDGLRTEPTIHQARGTSVHLALERLFESDAIERTPDHLYKLFRDAWTELRTEKYPGLFDSIDEERSWGVETLYMLSSYFSLEDPTSFEPLELEKDLLVDVGHMKIRGILDRMEEVNERGPDGEERTALVITDYKTGKVPRERYLDEAFFALKIYALLIRTSTGVTPTRIRLLYLKGPAERTLEIEDADLDTVAEDLSTLWREIEGAISTETWPTRTSPLCNWCDFKKTLCPAFNDAPEDMSINAPEETNGIEGASKSDD